MDLNEDPIFIRLEARVTTTELSLRAMLSMLAEQNKLASRLERFLIGGWDEESGTHVEGVDTRLKDVSQKADQAVSIGQSAILLGQSANKKFSWLLGGVWSVVVVIVSDVLSRIPFGELLQLLHH